MLFQTFDPLRLFACAHLSTYPVRVCVRVCVRACVRACVHACMRMRARVIADTKPLCVLYSAMCCNAIMHLLTLDFGLALHEIYVSDSHVPVALSYPL
jgi:hypothetical protein